MEARYYVRSMCEYGNRMIITFLINSWEPLRVVQYKGIYLPYSGEIVLGSAVLIDNRAACEYLLYKNETSTDIWRFIDNPPNIMPLKNSNWSMKDFENALKVCFKDVPVKVTDKFILEDGVMTTEERRESLKECQKALWDWMSERDRDIFNRVQNNESMESIALRYKSTVPSIRSTYNKVAKDMREVVDFHNCNYTYWKLYLGVSVHNALLRKNIFTLNQLHRAYTDKSLFNIHGIGEATMYKIAELLSDNGFDDISTDTPVIKVRDTNGEVDTLAVSINGCDYLVEHTRDEDGEVIIVDIYKSVKANNGIIKELTNILNKTE